MEIALDTLIELFTSPKETEGRSRNTVDWYRRMLTRFAKFMDNGSGATLKDVTLDNARAFVAALSHVPCQTAEDLTIARAHFQVSQAQPRYTVDAQFAVAHAELGSCVQCQLLLLRHLNPTR